MFRKLHNGKLSIKDFHVPFGDMLDTDNRRVISSSLMPWEELQEYMPLSSIPPLAPNQSL
jgi:transposase, IS5 family